MFHQVTKGLVRQREGCERDQRNERYVCDGEEAKGLLLLVFLIVLHGAECRRVFDGSIVKHRLYIRYKICAGLTGGRAGVFAVGANEPAIISQPLGGTLMQFKFGVSASNASGIHVTQTSPQIQVSMPLDRFLEIAGIRA